MGKPNKDIVSETVYKYSLSVRRCMDAYDLAKIQNNGHQTLALNDALSEARKLVKFLDQAVESNTELNSGKLYTV